MTEPTKRPLPPKALPADHLAFPASHFTEQWYVNVEHLDVQLPELFVPSFWRLLPLPRFLVPTAPREDCRVPVKAYIQVFIN